MPRRTAIILALGSAVFVAIGVLMLLRSPDQRVLALGCITFFGACSLVGFAQLLPTRTPRPDAEGAITILPNRAQMIAATVAAAALAVGCALIAWLAWADGRAMAASITGVGVPFFGVGAASLARRTLKVQPLMRLDREGVRQFGPAGWRLPWRAIRSIEVNAVASTRFLTFEADGTVAQPRNVGSRLNATLGVSAYNLETSGSDVSFETLHALVLEYWQRSR